ncbi:MAG: hypothetical protein ABSF63_06520 [Candidatus Bathyarchaeia archaeon]
MKTEPFVAIVTLILIVGVQMCVNVQAAPAIVVVDHAFAKGYKYTRNGNVVLTNRTSTFTQDDNYVWSYVQANFYSANLTWNWYDPSGELYRTVNWMAQCTTTPCSEIAGVRISGTGAASEPGIWRLDFLADGVLIYSDYFQLIAVINQFNYWNFTVVQSSPPRIHGSLRVVIRPNNLTWSSYSMYMPYASNVTAYDYSTNQSLQTTIGTNNQVVVNLGGPKSAGYSFVVKFDVLYVLAELSPGNFAFAWRELPYERSDDTHLVPESFAVNLPQGATLLDIVGYNVMNLNYSARTEAGLSLDFTSNVTDKRFGWTLLYRDLSQVNAQGNPNGPVGSNSLSGPLLPLLPLTLGSLTVWAAVMSVFLLTASELVSPIYSRTGYGVLLNRKRLRLAAILLVGLFIICIAYQFIGLNPLIQR